ncbi:MAG: DUF4445 domain-containing protein, partial [Chloroflexi bacterium]
MPSITVIYGETVRTVEAEEGSVIGEAIVATGLPLEQPCAGRGTCGKCKILAESGLAPPDEIEHKNLTEGELRVGNRLACRARVAGDVQVTLAPIVVYSNKIFRHSNRYRRGDDALGLAIDLGTTTVAALLSILEDGEVCAGGAGLNQQTVYGADVISRLAAATASHEDAERLHKLAVASINQAIDSLKLSAKVRRRIRRVVIVGNVAMHHLLARYPLDSLAYLPFQPYDAAPIRDAGHLLDGLFPEDVLVSLPPLIGGFVGSDALACLAYFGFDQAPGPMAAIDLGTNGEVLVTDGEQILTASTAAGPAFEGVNISCGTRAVDGAVVGVRLENGELAFDTIADAEPVGLTGSGLLSTVYTLRRAGVIAPGGRFVDDPPLLADRFWIDAHGVRCLRLTDDHHISLSQFDVRELQKAKGAIRAAIEILMSQLSLEPKDLQRVYLTGSFGGQVDIEAVLALGMLPPVRRDAVEAVPNGAGLGAAMFLTDEGFERGVELARRARQVDLDMDPQFDVRYVDALS